MRYYEFVTEHECGYFDGVEAKSLNNIFIDECSSPVASMLMTRGWRRFGTGYFKPVCPHCTKCESIRIDVSEFKLTKTFRNIKNKNKDTLYSLHKPSYSSEKVELHKKYHQERHERRGWKLNDMDEEKYLKMFVEGAGGYGYEIRYFRDAKLVGLDYIDLLPEGISSIYCFYDPDFAHLSLGTYSLLIQIELAKKLGLKHIYLGYIVRENPSLLYKLKYKPYDILSGRPSTDEEPIWEREEPQ